MKYAFWIAATLRTCTAFHVLTTKRPLTSPILVKEKTDFSTASPIFYDDEPIHPLPIAHFGVDLYCQSGDSTALLRRTYPHLDILGIENDLALWKKACQRYPNLSFYHGDILDMSLFTDRVHVLQIPLRHSFKVPTLSPLLSSKAIIRIMDDDDPTVLYQFYKHQIKYN
jgi:hypothetical protein